jgi:hypothetical protein
MHDQGLGLAEATQRRRDGRHVVLAVLACVDGIEVQRIEWDAADGGFLAGGYGRQANGAGRENAGRERLYLSPACKLPTKREQLSLV